MAQLLENSFSWKTPKSLSDQFIKPYKYYNPDFNFYKSNQITMKDVKWKIIPVLDDDYDLRESKIELENRLRDRVQSFIRRFESSFHPEWIQSEKDYQLDTRQRKVFLERMNKAFLTNEKMPIVRTKVDKVATGLYTQKYTVKVYSTKEENKDQTQSVQSYIERCFGSSKTRKAIIDASLDAVKYWVWYTRSWFRNIDWEQIQHNTKKWEIFEPPLVYPYATQIDPFCLYWDPTQDFYDTDIVYRDFFNIDKIEKEKSQYFKLSDNQRALIINNPQPFSYKNHKKVRLMKWLWWDYESVLHSSFDFFEQSWHNDFTLLNDDEFYQVNLNKDVCEYVEYWSWDNLVIAINGYIVYDYENPLPTKKHPFHFYNYTRVPWMWIWDGIGTMLAGMQKLYDIMFNAMYDMAKMKAWPMFKKKQWQQFEWMWWVMQRDPRTFLTIKWDPNLEIVETPSPSDVNFKMMNDIMGMIDFAVSPTSYNEIGWVSRSATDSEYRFQSLRDALRPLSESVNDAFSHLIDDWLIMWKTYLPEKIKVLVRSEDKKKKRYEKISSETLAGNYLFETEFDSLKDVNRSLERSQAIEFLQALQMIMKDPIDWRVLIDMQEIVWYVTQLYSKNNDFSLDPEEFYKRLKEWQERMSKIQKDLQPQEPQFPLVWQEGMPQNTGKAGASSSPVASEIWWVPQISELLKGIRE